MKKSFMNNIIQFVDSNVRQRIDKATNGNTNSSQLAFYGDDHLIMVERRFEDLRHFCIEAEKRISSLLLTLNNHSSAAHHQLGLYASQNVRASLNNLTSTHHTSITPANTAINPINPTIDSQSRLLPSNSNNTVAHNHNIQTNLSCADYSGNTQTPPNTVGVSASNCDSANELRNEFRQNKKLPIAGFLKFLVKSCYKLKPDSLLAVTLTHCTQLQTQLTKLYLVYEQTIELQCLKPLQHILEIDVPNVIKLKKSFIKAHNDLESVRAKYNGASQKQQQQQQLQTGHFTSTSYTITQNIAQQANINKLDQLKKELDESVTRFEQTRDTYASELYAFVCRETELINLFKKFYQYQADYHQQVENAIQGSMPTLNSLLANTPRKVVFGTPLDDHLSCTGRSVSLVIELCVHLLYSNGLKEEGLFRIPGSSVKIKKLKNAINAWFVTLANQNELESDQQQSSHSSANQSSLFAVHEMFKDIVGQRAQQANVAVDSIANHPPSSATTTASTSTTNNRDGSLIQQAGSSPCTQDQQRLVFDVHTIAGLLKLYLRELPEPLFTYVLYDEWIEATAKTMNNERPNALSDVVKKLPKTNYDNLHRLIRFLHLLTCHRESNKMTSANLAITMAPSLIWAKQSNQQSQPSVADGPQGRGSVDHAQDEMLALNMQMSSVGMSASLHALVIENIITRAEILFPEPVQFTVPGIDSSLVTALNDKILKEHADRANKSSSPTGLSTASSSSFSSNSNASLSLDKRGHPRKGGSMEGMLNETSLFDGKTRPVSVYVQSEHALSPTTRKQQKPPVPPAPASRSHVRQSSETNASFACRNPVQKPTAPTIPPQSAVRRQQFQRTSTVFSDSKPVSPTPASLRGTGSLGHSTLKHNSARPSVPPPNRPPRPNYDDAQTNKTEKSQPRSRSQNSDPMNNIIIGNSRSNPVNNQAPDFNNLHGNNQESPVISLDSISGDDSSFDQSLENSWDECVLDNDKSGRSSDKEPTQTKVDEPIKSVSGLVGNTDEIDSRLSLKITACKNDDEPPKKPPRSVSPKATQSTPL